MSANEVSVAEFRADMVKAVETGQVKADEALMAVALKVKNLARIKSIEGGDHAPGTPTPASKGRGPAKISGQLFASIDLQAEKGAEGLSIKVGTRETDRRRYAPSGAKRRTLSIKSHGSSSTNATVGAALEHMGYTFFKPAFIEATRGWEELFRVKFASGWRY